MATNLWTADRRLYLNSKGEAVEAEDASRVSLLVAAGGSIPLEQAQRLGLVEVTEQQVKALPPKRNKARVAPENK